MEDLFNAYEDALDETGIGLVLEASHGRPRPIRFRRQEIRQVLSLLDRGLSDWSENRELAAEILTSWNEAPTPPEVVVRRYDPTPFRIRDASSGISTGRFPPGIPPSAPASTGLVRDLDPGKTPPTCGL